MIWVSSYRSYNKKHNRFENLSLEESDAFLTVSHNKNVTIQKASKGDSVVIIDQGSYVKEMEKILSDAKKYLKVTFNPKGKANKEIVNILDIESSIEKLLK